MPRRPAFVSSRLKRPAVALRDHRAVLWLRSAGNPQRMKHTAEIDFWSGVFRREGGRPGNQHFAVLFQEYFGLTPELLAGKRLLDVGCGPTGTLDWATMAAERVGIDPLVDRYRKLGIDETRMRYVQGDSAAMPFANESFDVVSSFNSLDHVDDIHQSIKEIVRVLAPSGTLLLIVEVNHPPTVTEPVSLPWNLTSWFGPSMRTDWERRYESSGPNWFFEALFHEQRWDPERNDPRPGILVAKLTKIRL